MSRCTLILALGMTLTLGQSPAVSADLPRQPNIVLLLADDLGYGDVQCYNPDRGKIPTPNMDRLAREGMRFTDAHTSSGVCSPTRYTLLTGRYHWRTRLQQGIVNVYGAPLIAKDRLTVGSLAKQCGYHTACVGKWHLGWDWPITAKEKAHFQGLGGKAGGGGKVMAESTPEQRETWKRVFSQTIRGGPTERGFDEYFGTDVPNWPPYCFIEKDRTVGIPSTLLPASQLVRNQASLQGPALPGWKLDAVLPALADRAVAVIHKQAKANKPFLLYMPLTSPHTPIAVAREWQGKSSLRHPYADFVMQTDAVIGQLLDAIKQAGIENNTLVLFTSDNGCAPYIGAKELKAKGHFPSGPLRGYKADAWEGGHRVPFIIRWPGVVAANSRCEELVHQADVLATLAEILGKKLAPNAGEDSFSLVPLLKGGKKPIREHAVSQASSGITSLRQGSWKIIFGTGGGGYQQGKVKQTGIGQLYDLGSDLAEQRNLWEEKPRVVADLTAVMQRIVGQGRSTPGSKQANDVPVRWRRFLQSKK